MNRQLQARGRALDLSEPRIMGILNATPDSFSDGGRYAETRPSLVPLGESGG